MNRVNQPEVKVKSESYVSVGSKFFTLPLGGLHGKHAVQSGIWVPTQHLIWDQGKPRKTLIELVGFRTFSTSRIHLITSTNETDKKHCLFCSYVVVTTDTTMSYQRACVFILPTEMPQHFFDNLILFTICTSTFSKLCKNVYNGM
jgi:hypothetical protein